MGESLPLVDRLDDHDKLLSTDRTNADNRRCLHEGQLLDPLFESYRCYWTIGRGDDVTNPSADPQPASFIERTNVAGSVPPRGLRCKVFGVPQPVVAVAHMGATNHHLAQDTGFDGGLASRLAGSPNTLSGYHDCCGRR